MTQRYKVKDHLAIQPLKNKAVRIYGSIPDTTDGVWIGLEYSVPSYAYRMRDLEEIPDDLSPS